MRCKIKRTRKTVTHIAYRLFGLPLVYIGVGILLVSYAFGWLRHLTVGLAAIALIAAGTIGYIVHTRHGE